MNYGIMTFYFAHNYGAVLQAHALKTFIEENGQSAQIIRFAPKEMTSFYRLNPFSDSKSVKPVLKKALSVPRRLKQYNLFQSFISELVDYKKEYESRDELRSQLNGLDAVICGSDQIWNTTLTKNRTEYFIDFENLKIKKISYAASFGKKKLDDLQTRCIKEFLSNFDKLSIREEDGKTEIEALLDRTPSIVLDPVFLRDKELWHSEAEKSQYKPNNEYILYYSLREDKELIQVTEDLSRHLGIPIFVIHPTAAKQRIKGVQLTCVGPREFLWLIENAVCVSTNSFHASAFSVIFGKKYLHMRREDRETRIESLLKRFKCYGNTESMLGNTDILDFSKINRDYYYQTIQESKDFLISCIS